MARNAIESEFRTSKMADQSEMARNAIQSHFQKSKMATEKKNLYRSEMARFAIESEFRKSKMADRYEMARNAIESEFRKSKMAANSHFVINFPQKIKLHIDLKWPEMRSKVKFGHLKWPTSAICQKCQNKLKLRIDVKWIAINEIESDFRTSKMATGSHFVKKILKKSKNCIDLKWPFCQKFQKKIKFCIDLKWPEMRSKVIFGNPKMATGSHFVKKLNLY